jgi:uncharacterized MAPEG superfamily protein
MNALLSLPAVQSYVVAVAVIVVTLYGLGFNTAKVRAERKIVVNAEDSDINGGAKLADNDHADVLRIKRAHINLLENAVPFFVVGFLYSLTDPNLLAARVLFGVFVAVRVAHAVFYLTAKQPFRTLSFGIGALVNLAMVEEVLRALATK